MSSPSTASQFLDLVVKSGILTPAALDHAIQHGPPLPEEPVKCAAALVKQGLLTRFQARLLLSGKHRGFKLGPYIVLDQLGAGGMGTVFLAEHSSLRRKVALKVLAGLGTGADKLMKARFLREARASAALDHPNIVHLYDVAQHGEIHFLVMEYVDGQPLDKVLETNGPLPLEVVVDAIAQAATGLQHAHEKGFVHRDIKPANLMLAQDGMIKVLDLGLARSTDEKDKLTEFMDRGAVLGTSDYLAPEIALGHPPDARADIYSLGATMFELLAGRPIFEGNATQKLVHHQTTPPPSLSKVRPGIPPELAAVVTHMLAKNPDDRYQSAADVVAALTPWMTATGVSRVSLGMAATGAGSSPNMQKVLSDVVTRVDLSNTPRPWSLPTRKKAPSSRILSQPIPEPTESEDILPPIAAPIPQQQMMSTLAIVGASLTGAITMILFWRAFIQ